MSMYNRGLTSAQHSALKFENTTGQPVGMLQGTGLAVYTAETALRNYLTTGGSLFSAPGESPDSYRTVSTFLMIVSGRNHCRNVA